MGDKRRIHLGSVRIGDHPLGSGRRHFLLIPILQSCVPPNSQTCQVVGLGLLGLTIVEIDIFCLVSGVVPLVIFLDGWLFILLRSSSRNLEDLQTSVVVSRKRSSKTTVVFRE